MSSIVRYSSRREGLNRAFLAEKLKNARSYRRIAGYFRSSIFELVGEEIADIPDVRIICNSDLDVSDIAISQKVREAELKARWNEPDPELEALLHRDRYRRLYALLKKGNVQIRVVPKNRVFLHGKAGVIEGVDGRKICFLGSINETRSAFTENYEILWEDPSAEGIAWVEEEFRALWEESWPLPDAIVEEIKRISKRVVVPLDSLEPKDLPGASLAESPIYRGGEELQPWQRSFVTIFMEHRDLYGKVRLLLADEVGLGKTLSLGASAMISVLLGDGPVLVLCPATLTYQWQVELKDRLGIPSAVWRSSAKDWVDPHGHIIKTQGSEGIAQCPYQIAIVSTGLVVQKSKESDILLKMKFGIVILDEAHKARRRGGVGEKAGQPNNILDFMKKMGLRSKNILLGTATPFQTEATDLLDLLEILNSGSDFVLGRESVSLWKEWDRALPLIKGLRSPSDEREAWGLLRNPIPPLSGSGDHMILSLRESLTLSKTDFFSDHPFSSLPYAVQEDVRSTLSEDYFHTHNPVIRHTVLRRRDTLEKNGMLEKIEVRIHPDIGSGHVYGVDFIGLGLSTNVPFDLAYKAAQGYTNALKSRVKGAGFMESMLLQRICSSFASGKATAERMIGSRTLTEDDEEELPAKEKMSDITLEERGFLEQIISELSRPEATDPKLEAVKYFLIKHEIEGRSWLEHGSIIFSQYYDTAHWVAQELAKTLPEEPIGVYAGFGKSGIFRNNEWGNVDRETIKSSVKNKEIRLIVATDAACEGLNLQTLGTLINIDLPWNPSRLEQRLGRIKRFGQTRKTVDMLNLVYHDTRDEDIYQVISRRLREKFDIFGGVPDTIEDDWIESVEDLEKMLDQYIHLRKENKNVFDDHYQKTIAPDQNRWELCSRVLSRRDVLDSLSKPW